MAMPRKLKYLNTFLDGVSYLGVIESVTLPKLTRKLENYRGGGMEISLGGFPDDAIWSLYGAVGTGTLLRYAGSYQRDDTGETVAVEVETRFKVKEVDNGESKQGEDTSSKLSLVCTYYKLTMDGKELVEIDVLNMIEKVNGVDRLDQHRRNIGL